MFHLPHAESSPPSLALKGWWRGQQDRSPPQTKRGLCYRWNCWRGSELPVTGGEQIDQKILWNIWCFGTCQCFHSLVLSVWAESTFISQTKGTYIVDWRLSQPHEGNLPSSRAGFYYWLAMVPQTGNLSEPQLPQLYHGDIERSYLRGHCGESD